MRLICNVVVAKREATGFSNPRPCRGVLTIFREPKSKSIRLRISTSSKTNDDNLLGNGNIEAVFSKMIDNGMTTVRFKMPKIDLMISKADPIQLVAFMKVVNAAASGQTLPAVLNAISSSHQANSASSKIGGPAKVVITQRRDYPFWTPFSSFTTQLSIDNCRLTEFDVRVLKLKLLTHLTLTGNDFSSGRLNHIHLSPLRQLIWLKLSNNRLDELSEEFCRDLPRNVKVMSLASNRLSALPDALFEENAPAFTSIDISNNRIESLNKNIKDLKSTLAELDASGNCLTALPASISRLQLRRVDFTENPAVVECQNNDSMDDFDISESVPSLLELASVTTVRQKLAISVLPLSLQSYVNRVAKLDCDVCHRICLPSKAKVRRSSMDLRRISATVVTNGCGSGSTGCSRVKVKGICCSKLCVEAFLRGKF